MNHGLINLYGVLPLADRAVEESIAWITEPLAVAQVQPYGAQLSHISVIAVSPYFEPG